MLYIQVPSGWPPGAQSRLANGGQLGRERRVLLVVTTTRYALALLALGVALSVGVGGGTAAASPLQTATVQSSAAASPTASPTSSPSSTATATPTATPTVTLTVADDGSTIDLAAGSEVRVDLRPQRAGDIWTLPAPDSFNIIHRAAADSTGTTADLRTNGSTVLRSQTTNACSVAASPCAYTPQTWSVTLRVDGQAGPPDYSREGSCPAPPSTTTPGTRIVTAADSGRGVVVRAGETVQVHACGFDDPVTVASAGPPLFRNAVTARSGHRHVVSSFTADRAGGTEISWQTKVPCCFGRPDTLYRVNVTVVPADTPTRTEDQQCVRSLSGPNPLVLAGSRVPLVGQADPGATVRVYFRRHGTGAWTHRRTLVADSQGRFATDYFADAAYEWYAAAGLACETAPEGARLKPRISAPTATERGKLVTVRVAGEPGHRITVSFRRRGTSDFIVRRSGVLDPTGAYTTTYRADDDYRLYADDSTLGARGNTVLTQLR